MPLNPNPGRAPVAPGGARARRAANPTKLNPAGYAAEAGGAGTWYDPSTYSGQIAAQYPRGNGVIPKNLSDSDYNRLIFDNLSGGSKLTTMGTAPRRPPSGGSSGGGGGRGGGGGGGGGGGLPHLTQDQLNQMYALLGQHPPQETANPLNLPEYQKYQGAAFDPSMWQQLQGNLDTAVASDRQAAQGAYGDLTTYLNQNYRNAFAGQPNYASQGNAPGMDQQSMNRMLQAQGVDPNALGEQRNYAGGADAAFGNLLALLGANENQAQQNRLGNVQMDANTTNRAIDMAALQGKAGIGLQQGQAQQAWKQRQDDQAYQDWQNQQNVAQQNALQNWQRGNQVADTNLSNNASWQNTTVQALLGLLPQLAGQQLSLPTLQQLGLA